MITVGFTFKTFHFRFQFFFICSPFKQLKYIFIRNKYFHFSTSITKLHLNCSGLYFSKIHFSRITRNYWRKDWKCWFIYFLSALIVLQQFVTSTCGNFGIDTLKKFVYVHLLFLILLSYSVIWMINWGFPYLSSTNAQACLKIAWS